MKQISASQHETLIDGLFAATYHPEQRIDNPTPWDKSGHRKLALQMRNALISTQRYFLEDDFVRAAITLGVQHPDILLAMLPRARLPFRRMWIEWSQRVALEEQGIELDEGVNPQVGVYIEEISNPGEFPVYRMTEMGFISGDRPLAIAHFDSVIFCLDQPILERMPALYQDRSELARLTVGKDVLDACLLGSTYQSLEQDMSKWLSVLDDNQIGDRVADRKAMAEHRLTLCKNLASYATHAWSPFGPGYRTIMEAPRVALASYEHTIKHNILESAGTWRFVVTMLALNQARDYTSQIQQPSVGRRRFVGNKVVPYLQYWRVGLKLPRQIVLRKMIDSVRESLPQPAKLIEGYWRERFPKGVRNDCQHLDVSETVDRYRCVHCKRSLFFTRDYVRGSSLEGFVKKDRVVDV